MSNDPLSFTDIQQLSSLLDRFGRNHRGLPYVRDVTADALSLVKRVIRTTWPNGDETPGEKIRCTITVPDGYMTKIGIEFFEEAICEAAAHAIGEELSPNLDDGDSYCVSVFPLDVQYWEEI